MIFLKIKSVLIVQFYLLITLSVIIAEKLEITVAYTDGLIANGGISTDVFKKELGPEETKYFFDNIFFGTVK